VIVRLDHGLDQRDPMPEWAFANADISYESSVSGGVPEPERKEDQSDDVLEPEKED
jgi:hypothetical protein